MPAASPWQPCASHAVIHARAQLYAQIRDFFAQRQVLEVETPVLSRAATTTPAITSLHTFVHDVSGDSEPLSCWLHSSPELAMKRLLAAGCGSIYQLTKVFRDCERGANHHPEFTLLEWYRPGWTMHDLMAEVAQLIARVTARSDQVPVKMSYQALFEHHLKLDPWTATIPMLQAAAHQQGLHVDERMVLDQDGWLELLFSHVIQPQLGHDVPTFVYDFPANQAALARLRTDHQTTVAERFELFLQGVELANGFQELTDSDTQRQRFMTELLQRHRTGQVAVPIDELFLDALAAGLPDCAGVAVGIDRLLMCIVQATTIDDVLTFPIERS
jgi:lysyl-tRNA synthetase class 2